MAYVPKKCEKCGKDKYFGHFQECHLNQTRNIINTIKQILSRDTDIRDKIKEFSVNFLEKYKLTWEQLVDFENLSRVGLDTVGANWCRQSFKYYEQIEDRQGKQTILDNIISVLFCYDINSTIPITNDICQTCNKSIEKCRTDRSIYEQKLKEYILESVTFQEEDMVKFRKTYGMTHLSFMMFHALLNAFHAVDETYMFTAKQIYYLIIEYIYYAEFQKLMCEVDRMI